MKTPPPKKSNLVLSFALDKQWMAVLDRLSNLQDKHYPGDRSRHQFARDLLLTALADRAQALSVPHPTTLECSGARGPRRVTEPPRKRTRTVRPEPLPPRAPKAPRVRHRPGPAPTPALLPPELHGVSPSELLQRAAGAARSSPEGVQATLDAILGPGAVQASSAAPASACEDPWRTDDPPKTTGRE